MPKPNEIFREFEAEQKRRGVTFPQQFPIRIEGKNVEPRKKDYSDKTVVSKRQRIHLPSAKPGGRLLVSSTTPPGSKGERMKSQGRGQIIEELCCAMAADMAVKDMKLSNVNAKGLQT